MDLYDLLFAFCGLYLLAESGVFALSARIWFPRSVPIERVRERGWAFALHYSAVAVVAYVLVGTAQWLVLAGLYEWTPRGYRGLGEVLAWVSTTIAFATLLASRPLYFRYRARLRESPSPPPAAMTVPRVPRAAFTTGILAGICFVNLLLVWSLETLTFVYCAIDDYEYYFSIFAFEALRAVSAYVVYRVLRLDSGFFAPYGASSIVYVLMMVIPTLHFLLWEYEAPGTVIFLYFGYFFSWTLMAYLALLLRGGRGSLRSLLRAWLGINGGAGTRRPTPWSAAGAGRRSRAANGYRGRARS